MAKVSKQDWIEQSIAILAASGHKAVTLEALLKALGVSHGSFYHHFKNRRELTEAMLDHWEQSMTVDIVARSGEINNLSERVESLIEAGEALIELQTPLENAIRSWAQSDEVVKAAMERVDLQRRENCRSIAALVVADKNRAQTLGDLVHAVFVGSQQCLPPYTASETRAVYTELQKLLLH